MGKWLTPNSIPEPTICRLLLIPEEPTIIGAVSGALLPLTYDFNWEEFGEVSPQEMANAMQKMYWRWLKGSCQVIGSILTLATRDMPDGVLECDGSLYARTDYPDLYAVIDSHFVVDSDSFRVPDIRSNVIIGSGLGYTIGDTGGEVEHTLTSGEMPAHTHTTHGHLSAVAVSPGELPVSVPNVVPDISGSTGGGGAHNNLQPYIVLKYGIVAK